MTLLMRWLVVMAAALSLLVGPTTRTNADITFNISDLAEGPPTLVSPTGTPFTIQPDSQGEFLHFTFQGLLGLFPSTFSTDLHEPGTGELSDRFLIDLTSTSGVFDAKFDSRDPVLLPKGSIDLGFFIENGTPQLMFAAQGGGATLLINAASDVVEVPMPQPSSLLLISLGAIWTTLGYVLRRHRSVV